MKLLALIIMGLLTWGNTLSAQMTEGNKKILVAYFSCTGTTEKVAEAIAETTGDGVFIGPKCNLGAQSVVTHDVPPMTIVAGNPARIIKKFEINHE